jgi:restriction system protein
MSIDFTGVDTLWVVHIGNDQKIGIRAIEEEFICIGWTRLGDLSAYDSRSKMKTAMKEAFPDWKPAQIRSSYGQPFRFAHKMKVGDPVIYPVKSSSKILIGRVSGPYEWSTDEELKEKDYNNVRPVEWLKEVPRTVFSQAALHSFGSFLSVSTSDDYLEEVQEVLEKDIEQLLTGPAGRNRRVGPKRYVWP